MRVSRGRRSGFFLSWESVKYFAMADVDCDDIYVQCDKEWQQSWKPAGLLQVLNPPSFSYQSDRSVSDAADFGRHRLSAVARAELLVLFLTFLWNMAQRSGKGLV